MLHSSLDLVGSQLAGFYEGVLGFVLRLLSSKMATCSGICAPLRLHLRLLQLLQRQKEVPPLHCVTMLLAPPSPFARLRYRLLLTEESEGLGFRE